MAESLDKEAGKIAKKQKILLEVNIGEEEQKYGFKKEEIADAIPEIKKMENIELCGLMAMAPYFEDAEQTRPYFKEMKKSEFVDRFHWMSNVDPPQPAPVYT